MYTRGALLRPTAVDDNYHIKISKRKRFEFPNYGIVTLFFSRKT